MNGIWKNNKGFSIIELVILVAIIAILSVLTLPKVIGKIEEARKTIEIADAKTLANEITVLNVEQRSEDGTLVIEKNCIIKN